MATVTRIRRFQRGLTDGRHHSTVATRIHLGVVQFHATCSCGWESPNVIDANRAQAAYLSHLRHSGVRAAG